MKKAKNLRLQTLSNSLSEYFEGKAATGDWGRLLKYFKGKYEWMNYKKNLRNILLA